MEELPRYRSFANTRSDALHRTMPHIAHRKDSGNICFEQEWISVERPAPGTFPVANKVWASQEEPPLVSLDQISQPVRSRQGSNKDEDRTCRHPLQLVGIRTKHRKFFQARFAVHLGHAYGRPQFNTRRLLRPVCQIL